MQKTNIPKVIHYCWFGNSEKPELVLKCIDSWRKYMPDYEIKEWNETNFDINSCDYVIEAYKSKKWAFVSDYCRVWVLYHFGGVYFDTDVEIIKDPGDILEAPTIGFENKSCINPGLVFSAEKDDWFCKEMMDSYEQDHFYVDNKINLITICDRATKIFVFYGLKLNNKMQQVKGYNIYPSDYFNPLGSNGGYLKITSNTVSIHNFAGTWIDDEIRNSVNYTFKGKVFVFLEKIMGESGAKKLRRFYKKITGGK